MHLTSQNDNESILINPPLKLKDQNKQNEKHEYENKTFGYKYTYVLSICTHSALNDR